MKALAVFIATILTAFSPLPVATAADVPLEATEATQAATQPTSEQGRRWREDALAWSNPLRLEGVHITSINEASRPVLVIGTVNGNVSTNGHDIAVLGSVNGNVTAKSGHVFVLGAVNGNASAEGGDVRIAGVVNGRASSSNGKVEVAPGGRASMTTVTTFNPGNFDLNFDLGNRKWSYRSRGGNGPLEWLADFLFSPMMLLWRSGLLFLWVAVGCTVATLCPAAVVRARDRLRETPVGSGILGVLWAILFFVFLAIFAFLCVILVGFPLILGLVLFDLAVGVFGMTLVFATIGDWLARHIRHSPVSVVIAVFAGACVLGLMRLIPIIGPIIWYTAGLCGAGAALTSRFGSATAVPPMPGHPALLTN